MSQPGQAHGKAIQHGASAAALLQELFALSRAQFRYFAAGSCPASVGGNPTFMENAGGSQVPTVVADAMHSYMLNSYAQLGAGYPLSTRATQTVADAHAAMRVFMGAADAAGEVIIGPSSSQLLAHVGDCYSQSLGPDDELVVHEACHEANVGPWVRAAARSGAKLLWWRVAPPDVGCTSRLEDLLPLLGPRTRIVAVTHVSNLLGEVLDVAAVVAAVRRCAPRARVVVDGVAYAPHLPIDVSAWGVDWCVWYGTLLVAVQLFSLSSRSLGTCRCSVSCACRVPCQCACMDGPLLVSASALSSTKSFVHHPNSFVFWSTVPHHVGIIIIFVLCCGCRYVFSNYKTWGPHVATMFGATAALTELLAAGVAGPNHYFVPGDDFTYKWELGGVCHEACAGLVALKHYLHTVAAAYRRLVLPHADDDHTNAGLAASAGGATAAVAPFAAASNGDGSAPAAGSSHGAAAPQSSSSSSAAATVAVLSRCDVDDAFAAFQLMESVTQGRLLSYLSSHPNVILIGPKTASAVPAKRTTAASGDGAVTLQLSRVPTVSFVHRSKPSQEVARGVQAGGIAMRAGHMYAKRLVESVFAALGRTDAPPSSGSGAGGPALAAVTPCASSDGVVRISLLHYNTPEEVEQLIRVLDAVL